MPAGKINKRRNRTRTQANETHIRVINGQARVISDPLLDPKFETCRRIPILDGVELMPLPCTKGVVECAFFWAGLNSKEIARLLRMRECDVVVIIISKQQEWVAKEQGL